MNNFSRLLRIFLPVVLATSFAPLVNAQGAAAQSDKSIPASKVEMKNRAPVSKEILKVNLPKPYETKLSNGLTVLILENHRLPTATVQFNISGAGAVYEPADEPGLASMTAAMVTQGTSS